jgi:lysyl-tRNA synthetase class 2
MSGKRWWHPDEMAERLPRLRARAAILAAVRGFFAQAGFDEVETPALQVAPGMEPHLQAFATTLDEPFGQGSRRLYLHTSPEFAMKKLLVGGVPKLFQLARVWRNGERSATHHPEFTMLEWYRAGASYRDLMDDCEGLLRACLTAAGGEVFRRGAVRCDPFRLWRRISVAEAFREFAGIEVLDTADDCDALAAEARRIGLHVGEADSWDDVFFRVMFEKIEPHLGHGAPAILYDYPVSMAALSRPSPADPRVAERFELYVCGVELANAFGELTDPAEQRRRFVADMDLKERLYGERWPLDEDFLAALEFGMPDSAGIALGLDRLVMLAVGAESIDEVLWAPVG